MQNASGTAALSVNTSTLTTTLQAGTDTTTLGSNLITCTDFTNATSPCTGSQWTTTNWTTVQGPPSTATHVVTGGNTSALSTSEVTPVNGSTYEISFTVTGTPAAFSTIVVSFGGVTAASDQVSASAGNFTDTRIITATSNSGPLTFTPTSGFNGTISAVSIQLVTQQPNAALVVKNASGTADIQVTASSSTTNEFIGLSSGQTNSTGIQDTVLGANDLQNNTTGSQDSALGYQALQLNTTGSNNTAVGNTALQANTVGINNTAVGSTALQVNTTGSQDSALGYQALQHNTMGTYNTAVGYEALQTVVTGLNDTAVGGNALRATTASANTAVGINDLLLDTTGSGNTAIGDNAGDTNTSANATTSGSGNTFLGYNAGQGESAYQVSDSTALGQESTVNQSNAIILGCLNGQDGCSATTTVGIGTQYAPNALTVSPGQYNTGTITQSGTTITGSGTTFTTSMTGGTIYYSDGTTATVTYISATSLTSSVSKTISSAATYTIVYGGFNVSSTGTAYLQPTTDSTTAFQVQNAAGSQVFNVNSTNQVVGIGTVTSTGSKLTVTASAVVGETINQTGSSDILDLQQSSTNVFKVSSTGAVTSENSTNSTTAFQIQNASATPILTVNTSGNLVTLGANTQLTNTSASSATGGGQVISVSNSATSIALNNTGGTDYTFGTTYVAEQFNSGSNTSIGSFSVQIKEDAGINSGAWITGEIFTDSGGSPGSVITNFGSTNIYASTLSTSYQNVPFGVGNGGSALTTNTNYWIVLVEHNATGGNFYLNSNTGSNLGATSSTGTSWTLDNTELYYTVYGISGATIGASSVNTEAISASSTAGFGIIANSTNSYGVYGLSTNSTALRAASTNGLGANITSTNSTALQAISTGGVSGFFETGNTSGTNGSPTVEIQANTSQTSNLLSFLNSSGTAVSEITAGGALQGGLGSGTNGTGGSLTLSGGPGTGTGVGGNINLKIAQASATSGSSLNSETTVESLSGTNGSALFQNSINSTTAFQVQNAAGTSTPFDVDTSDGNGRVGIGTNAPGNLLSVGALTTADSTAQLAVTTGGTGNKALVLQAVTSQSADILDVENSGGSVLFGISSSGHIITGGTTPTAVVGAASGGGSVSVSGDDTFGTITVTTGSSPSTSGVLATLTFNSAFGTAPRVVISPSSAASSSAQYYEGTVGTTTFQIDVNAIPFGATSYSFNYFAGQ